MASSCRVVRAPVTRGPEGTPNIMVDVKGLQRCITKASPELRAIGAPRMVVKTAGGTWFYAARAGAWAVFWQGPDGEIETVSTGHPGPVEARHAMWRTIVG